MLTWVKCQSFPIKQEINISKPMKFDAHSFIVSTTTTITNNGIYKYDIKTNEWNKLMSYNNKFNCNMHSTAYDEINKLFYLSTNEQQLIKCDLKLKNIKILLNNNNLKIFNFK